jgi:hypothetical protein
VRTARYSSFFVGVSEIVQKEGIASLYSGLTPTMLGIIPYAGKQHTWCGHCVHVFAMAVRLVMVLHSLVFAYLFGQKCEYMALVTERNTCTLLTAVFFRCITYPHIHVQRCVVCGF